MQAPTPGVQIAIHFSIKFPSPCFSYISSLTPCTYPLKAPPYCHFECCSVLSFSQNANPNLNPNLNINLKPKLRAGAGAWP